MTTPEQEIIEQPEIALLYQISFERLAELRRSPIAIVADRRPKSAPSRKKPDSELPDAKKVADEIASYCADDDDFIRTEMPIQEIVFRLLLTRRNTPTLLSDLHYELTDPGGRHHHMVCQVCHSAFNLSPHHLEKFRRTLKQEFGFEPDLEHFTVSGVCSECQSKHPEA